MPLTLCWRKCSEDGHRMYFRGLLVGKTSTTGIGILPTTPIIFTGGQKVWNLASFKTSLNFEPRAFENAARHLNSETKVQCCDDRPMSLPSLVKLGPHTPENTLSVVTHPVKFNGIFGWVHLLPYCIVYYASRSRTPDTRSQHNVRNEQQECYRQQRIGWATSNLAWASLKQKGTASWVALNYSAFAITTFSS